MIAASVVILTAGYILWTIQRVYLGPEYKGPHGDHLTPMTRASWRSPSPLLAFAILFGVYPNAIFHYMTPSVNREVDALAEWTKDVKSKRRKRSPTPSVPRPFRPRSAARPRWKSADSTRWRPLPFRPITLAEPNRP